jgi:hypothetical protein
MSLFKDDTDVISPLDTVDIIQENEKLRRDNDLIHKDNDNLRKEFNDLMREHLFIVEQVRQKTLECEKLRGFIDKLERPQFQQPAPVQKEEQWTDPFSKAIESLSDFVMEQFKIDTKPQQPEQHEQELPDVKKR